MRQVLPLLEERTTFYLIRTNIKYCYTVEPKAQAAAVASHCLQKENDFSIVPVVSGGKLVGVFFPKSKDYANQTVKEVMEAPGPHLVDRNDRILPHMHRLVAEPGLLVSFEGKLDGVVSYADLNKRAFRVILYANIAELEGRMADFIRRKYPDADLLFAQHGEAMSPDAHKAWVMGKAKGVGIHPTEGCTLSDLVKIARSDDEVRAWLGYSTKTALDDDVGGLVQFRNSVMHPVRSLVSSPEDAEKLSSRIVRVTALLERTTPQPLPGGSAILLPE